jgi:hypothetical protein
VNADPILAGDVHWSQLPDDLDALAILSLDLRTSWSQPEDPWAVAAWRKWQAIKRWQRDLPLLRDHARVQTPPPAVAGHRPNLSDALRIVDA